MYPPNPEKLAAAAPELLALLYEANLTMSHMALLIPKGVGDEDHYEKLYKEIQQAISKVYDK
jgi:hypothetical protein